MAAFAYAICVSCLAFGEVQYQAASITLPNGAAVVGIRGISSSHQVIINASIQDAATGQQYGLPFVWANGVLNPLSLPPGFVGGGALGINNSGVIVGGVTDMYGVSHPVVWPMPNQPPRILDQGGSEAGVAYAVSNDGQIVGMTRTSGDAVYATVWDGNGLVARTAYGSDQVTNVVPIAINTQGQAVVDSFTLTTSGTFSGYLPASSILDHGNAAWLGTFGKYFTEAHAANGSGQITGLGTVFEDGAASHVSFLWQEGTYTALGRLPSAYWDDPWAINDGGVIVGGSFGVDDANPWSVATIWIAGEPLDLNTLIPQGSGWDLQNAAGITDDGVIVGIGTYDGQSQGFILTPTGAPEPASAVVLLVVAPLLLRRRRGGAVGV